MWRRPAKQTNKIIFDAQVEAIAHGRTTVASEYLLSALLRDVIAVESIWPPTPTDRLDTQDIIAVLLYEAGANLEQLKAEVQHQVTLLDIPCSRDAMTPSAIHVLNTMYEEAKRISVVSITPEFLFLALIRDTEGTPGQVLAQFGLEIETARQKVDAIYESMANITDAAPH